MKRLGIQAPGLCGWCGRKQVFTTRTGTLEPICSRGCDDLPFVGTLPPTESDHGGVTDLGLDARDGCVAVRGWQETSDTTVEGLLDRFADLPLAAVLHTDIRRDGMLEGPNLEATAALGRRVGIPVIASGGVSSIEDLLRLARTRVIAGAIVGRAIYTGAIDLADALRLLDAC